MKVIYQNADGFRVVWQHGFVEGLNKGLQAAIEKYGLSTHPDLEELQRIMAAVFKWMASKSMGWNIGYPVYANDDYFDELIEITGDLVNVNEQGMDVEGARLFLQGAMARFHNAAWNHFTDIMSR